MTLEEYLYTGTLQIGRVGQFHLKGTYVLNSPANSNAAAKKHVSVESQRGIKHVLDAILMDLENTKLADHKLATKYPYSLTHGTATTVDYLFEDQTYAEITAREGEIFATCFQYTVPTNAKAVRGAPGQYTLTGSGKTVMEALTNACAARHVPCAPTQKNGSV